MTIRNTRIMVTLNLDSGRDVEVILNALLGHEHSENQRAADTSMPQWLRDSHAREAIEAHTLYDAILDQKPSDA